MNKTQAKKVVELVASGKMTAAVELAEQTSKKASDTSVTQTPNGGWIFNIKGTKVKLNKAQARALRQYERQGTSPKFYKQLERKKLVSEVNKIPDAGKDKYWDVPGRSVSTGFLTDLGNILVDIMYKELGAPRPTVFSPS